MGPLAHDLIDVIGSQPINSKVGSSKDAYYYVEIIIINLLAIPQCAGPPSVARALLGAEFNLPPTSRLPVLGLTLLGCLCG